MKYTVAMLLAASFAIVAAIVSFDAAAIIIYGWIPFLCRVVPQVTVDGPSAIVGVMAFALFFFGVHLAGRRLRPMWKLRWTIGAILGITILFTSGIAFVGMIHQTAWLATSEEPIVRETIARREYAVNSLKQMGFAFANFHDITGKLPAGGTVSPSGELLQSWETQILPFLSYSTAGIDQNRPWNDPVNQPIFKSVLPIFINGDFRAPALQDRDGYGLSHYAVNQRVIAADTKMNNADIADGLSNTILVGEVNANFQPWGHPVNWRDPAIGFHRSARGFGGPPGTGSVLFLMADGTTKRISHRIDPKVLKALSTPNGGEAVE